MKNHYKLIVHEQPKSPIAEAYRILRTNIQFSKIDGDLRTVMFTSVGPEEGKSTTVANTAIALAQSGKQVIICDCDLRKPVQHIIFNKKNQGLTNILAEKTPVRELITDTGIKNLKLLPSGPIPPNPSELLGSAGMAKLMGDLKDEADIVIFDVPPVAVVTDACVLASRVNGVILVVCAGLTKPDMAQQAKELLLKTGGKVLGVVLNRVNIEYGYSYNYYYYRKAE